MLELQQHKREQMQLVCPRHEACGRMEGTKKYNLGRGKLFCDFLPQLQKINERRGQRVTKAELSQYGYLQREAERVDQLLEEMDKMRHRASEEELEFLNLQQKILREKKKRSLKLRKDIYSFVDNVNDCLVRMILFERYINDKTWVAVAHVVGGGNTHDSVRKIAERYLAK